MFVPKRHSVGEHRTRELKVVQNSVPCYHIIWSSYFLMALLETPFQIGFV